MEEVKKKKLIEPLNPQEITDPVDLVKQRKYKQLQNMINEQAGFDIEADPNMPTGIAARNLYDYIFHKMLKKTQGGL